MSPTFRRGLMYEYPKLFPAGAGMGRAASGFGLLGVHAF